MNAGFDHIGILVSDADAAAQEYVARFGLVVIDDEFVTSRETRLVWMAGRDSGGSAEIQLLEPRPSTPLARQLQSRGEGLHHLCLSVGSLTAALDPELRPEVFLGGRGRLCAFIGEHRGVLIELAESSATTGGPE